MDAIIPRLVHKALVEMSNEFIIDIISEAPTAQQTIFVYLLKIIMRGRYIKFKYYKYVIHLGIQMALYFNEKQKKLILSGKMTKTCRAWKTSQAQVGQIKQARTKRYLPSFATLEIKGVAKEKLGTIVPTEIGFDSSDDFKKAWLDCYLNWSDEEEVWVVKFEVVKNE